MEIHFLVFAGVAECSALPPALKALEIHRNGPYSCLGRFSDPTRPAEYKLASEPSF